jgi:hypothetical protein
MHQPKKAQNMTVSQQQVLLPTAEAHQQLQNTTEIGSKGR